MTLRMPPWEAEKIANALKELALIHVSVDPWASDCAARIKAQVKAEKERREAKRKSALKECCRTCKWLAGERTLEPNCIKREFVIPAPDNISCCYYEENKNNKRQRTEDRG